MATAAHAPETPTLVLEPDDRAPRLARRFLAERFAEWGISDDYIGRVVVSELVTNAYLHGKGQIVVRVFRDERDRLVVVEVWDAGEGRPRVRPEDHAATSGRGLLLMAEIVHGWGVRPLNEGGKVTWAKLRDRDADWPLDRR
jgi:anti-sigma regulatory factor (Ser/Thr protein kinase)